VFHNSIWIYTLSGGFRSSINSSMTAYATSEFGLHSLLTIVDIVSGAMTAACYIPLAKGLDLWGRAEGFVLMVGMLTLGMVLQAAAPNLPALCAGRVGDSFFQLLILVANISCRSSNQSEVPVLSTHM
jgi:MFS family permease